VWVFFIRVYFSGPALISEREVFIQVRTDQEEQLFAPQVPTVVALSKGCKTAKVVRNATDIPAGCGSAVVTPSIIVHTLVRVRPCSLQHSLG
jgi:valyl-tRNA synthetase